MTRAGRPGGTYTQADRVLDLREVLIEAWPSPMRVNVLAEHFEVTERTVRRDLAVLEQRGEALHSEGLAEWTWCPPSQREELLAMLPHDRIPPGRWQRIKDAVQEICARKTS